MMSAEDILSNGTREGCLEPERGKSPELFERIFDNMNMLIAYMDRDFNFLKVNGAYAKAGAHEPEFFTGKNHFDLYPNEENQVIFRRVVETGEPNTVLARPFEYKEYPERGITYWNWTLQPVKETGGGVSGVVLTLYDVTEQVRAEKHVRQAHAELEARVQERTEALSHANQALQSEIAERKRMELELENHLSRLDTLLEISKLVMAEKTIDGLLQQTADAALKLVQANVAVCGHGFENEAFRILASSRGAGMPGCPPGENFTIRRGGVYLDVIEKGETLRLNREELTGHPNWWGLPEGHFSLDGLLAVPIAGEEGSHNGLLMLSDKVEGDFTEEDESLLQQLAALASLALQHIEAHISLERSNREMQDFTFIASHDLQEPLRKIQAFATRIEQKYSGLLDATGTDYLHRMVKASGRMQQMIIDLLAYSRIATKGEPFVQVDLEVTASAVLSDLEITIAETGAQVEIGPLPVIEADALQMHQLLQNLIANAIKFHKPGVAPVVKVCCLNGSLAENGLAPAASRPKAAGLLSMVTLAIEDNGIGFEEEFTGRIFQPFQRLNSRCDYEGNGIGLAICRQIVDRHGGAVDARSAPGEGSKFIITLPRKHNGDERVH
ncbi:MAG: PAS domain S-box protein [Chloroflexota bacterium]|nr:MAG: PAS domain S-box protein [Chloroflexota bacterium]